jgi:hypothetical protein
MNIRKRFGKIAVLQELVSGAWYLNEGCVALLLSRAIALLGSVGRKHGVMFSHRPSCNPHEGEDIGAPKKECKRGIRDGRRQPCRPYGWC